MRPRSAEARNADELDLIRARRSRERPVDLDARPVAEHARVALVYPSPYRAGMSSLGFQTLYGLLNRAGVPTHRAFLPDAWEPMALAWPQPRRRVVTYEAERPISDYPILGLSVAYELEIAGVIRMLEGTGIPLLAADRGPRDPIVIGGGPLTFANPSCLLPFVDVLICGEAEDLLLQVIRALDGGGGRSTAIAAACAIEGVLPGERTPGVWPSLPKPARASPEHLPARSAILTPDAELSDMLLVEPERGCSRRCTFCVLRRDVVGGMRILDMERPLSQIPAHARRVGLVGAAVTDHPQLLPLVAAIVESGREIGISSLRADRLTPELCRLLRESGHRTLTVASDGISERMRSLLHRKIHAPSLVHAAELARAHGYHRLKVYQMIGAPEETEDDVDELIRFALELAKIHRLTLTFSTFVAKRNTPLDGQPFVGVKEAERRLKKIRAGLRGRVELRPQSPRWAHVEYLLAQRGADSGHAAIRAVHAGARYADWVRAFEETPAVARPLRFGDEEAWARRKGKAARRPALPIVHDAAPRSPE